MIRIPIIHITNSKGEEIDNLDHFSSVTPRIGESIIDRNGKSYVVIDVIHSSWWTNGTNMACQIDVVVKLRRKLK